MALLDLLARSAEGLTVLGGGPPFEQHKLVNVSCVAARFSKDGSKLAIITPEDVKIYDTCSYNTIQSVALPGVTSVHFSPLGSFIQTFQKPSSGEKNAGIWDVKSGAPVLQFSQKSISSSTWPALQFSEDETVACRFSSGAVSLYDCQDFGKGTVDQLRFPGLQAVQLSHAPPSYIATYVPESKGQPAVVRIHSRSGAIQSEPVARRSFFKSSGVTMSWNRDSTGLLVLAYSEDDKSNKSYYGESKLHYLRSDGTFEGSVALGKDGPVHDAQWSPTGKEFIAVYGFMPARATLFDTQCKPLLEVSSGSFNTVKWNPFGTFVCLAGFGNLPGDMVFWDRSKQKQLGSAKAACSVTCEWSPSGRLLLTAVTAPRMQVDNGIKVFKYTGQLLEEKKIDKLYQAEWKNGVFEDRPASPDSKAQQRSASASVNAKPAAYRPPQASNMAAVRAQLFGEEEKSGGEVSKSALRNKKRRAKQKDKAADPVDEAAEQLGAVDVSETASSQGGTASSQGTGTGVEDPLKKLRALRKKLRQLEELKTKLSGQTPSQPQKDKLAQEASIRAEIQSLEAAGIQ